MNDAVDCVQQLFPCTAPARSIFLAGLSMGGYGALRIGAKFPERFCAIAAHSAITHISQFDQFVGHSMNEESMPPEESNILHWIRRNSDRLPALRFDCGRNDDLFEANEALHRELETIGVAHQFVSYDGEHNWDYWKVHLEDSLLFFEDSLRGIANK